MWYNYSSITHEMRTENTPGLEKPVTFCGLILQEPKKDNVFHILIQHLWMTLGSQKFWEIPQKMMFSMFMGSDHPRIPDMFDA